MGRKTFHAIRKEQQASQGKRERGFSVWVDGDRKELIRWARKNGVNKVPLATASSKQEPWKSLSLDRSAHDTTIVVEQGRKVLAVFTNLENDNGYAKVAAQLPARNRK